MLCLAKWILFYYYYFFFFYVFQFLNSISHTLWKRESQVPYNLTRKRNCKEISFNIWEKKDAQTGNRTQKLWPAKATLLSLSYPGRQPISILSLSHSLPVKRCWLVVGLESFTINSFTLQVWSPVSGFDTQCRHFFTQM